MLAIWNKIAICYDVSNKAEFNEISSMLQFYLIFDSEIATECPEDIFKNLSSDKYLFIW